MNSSEKADGLHSLLDRTFLTGLYRVQKAIAWPYYNESVDDFNRAFPKLERANCFLFSHHRLGKLEMTVGLTQLRVFRNCSYEIFPFKRGASVTS